MRYDNEPETMTANVLTMAKSRLPERLIDDPLAEILGEIESPESIPSMESTHELLKRMTSDHDSDPLSQLTLLREVFERKRYYLNEIELHID